MNEYKAFYGNKQPIDVYAGSSYAAQLRAATVWNLKPSQRCKITVVLAQLNGEPVTHIATE
jgi:hypothetical protein